MVVIGAAACFCLGIYVGEIAKSLESPVHGSKASNLPLIPNGRRITLPGKPEDSQARSCIGLTNFNERLDVTDLITRGNYTKKGYFDELYRARQYRGGHQYEHLLNYNSGSNNGNVARPLCLQNGGKASILPTSCLQNIESGTQPYNFVVFVGASLTREVAWSFVRHTFDPPAEEDLQNDYCQPYAFGNPESSSTNHSTNVRFKEGGKAWNRAMFKGLSSPASWPNINCPKGLKSPVESGCELDLTKQNIPPEQKLDLASQNYSGTEQIFDFARNSTECCNADGGFWTRMVQLNMAVRMQKGNKPTIRHDRLIELLFKQLAKNCPCKGLIYIGIGVHELFHGRPWYDDRPTDYGHRTWIKEAEDEYERNYGLNWTYPFGRERGMRSMLSNVMKTLRGTSLVPILADTVQPQPLIMHARPPKKWADTESFGDMLSLTELFHKVDTKVAAEFDIPLIPYYETSNRYGGLQCDGIHFGKSSGSLYGCNGFPIVTDVAVQSMLNIVCKNVTPAIGCQ